MPNTSWMGLLAQEKRNKTQEELKYVAAKAIKTYRIADNVALKLYNKQFLYNPALVRILDGVYKSCQELGWTLENFWSVQRTVIHRLYGDPRLMAQSNGARVHSLPYWNPTSHKLNVAPMGIVESLDEKTREAKFQEFVGPGDMIWLPEGYTKGGKYSTVAGVAPQLRPLPRAVGDYLDVAPLTYTEWCTYTDNVVSECCNSQAIWHSNKDCLICGKCGNSVRGKPDNG